MTGDQSEGNIRTRAAARRVRRPDGVVLVSTSRHPPVALAADADRVIWSDGKRVLAACRSDGDPSLLAASDSATANRLACDDRGVYFAAGSTVWLAGATASATRPIARARGRIGGLAAADGFVYWTEPRWGTVGGVRVDGGPSFVVAFGQCHPTAIAADPTCAYWVNAGSGEIARAAREGGVVQVLASRQDGPTGLALDESHAYWLAGASVVRVPKRGGPPQPVTTIGEPLRDVAVGGACAYVSLDASPCVLRVPVTGGIATCWARWSSGPAVAIAADEQALFVAEAGTWEAHGRGRGDGGILMFRR